MSNNINVTVLSGRVCADAELKYTNNGTAICNFSLAVNKFRSSPDGQGKEEVSFFNCSMFGKSAESFNQRLLKGVPVIINGELKQDRWNDQDGKTQSRVHIIVNRVEVIFTGQQSGQQQTQSPNQYMYANPPQNQGPQVQGYQQQSPNQGYQRQGYPAPQSYSQASPANAPVQSGYKPPQSYQAPLQTQLDGMESQSGLRHMNGNLYQGPESFRDDDIPF